MTAPTIPPLQAGVSYKVQLRATPGHSASGAANQTSVMWTAELVLGDGVSLAASGYSAADALERLHHAVQARLAAEA